MSDDHLTIVDRDSSNGVFFNGLRVARAEVRPGDMLRLGDTALVRGPRAPGVADEEADLGLLGASTLIGDPRRAVRRVARRRERSMLDHEMIEPPRAAPPPPLPRASVTLPPERPAELEKGPPSREELIALLDSCDGNVSLAAARAGRNRKQVYRWMEQYGVLRGTGR